jgi:dihydrofolate reductase
VTLDGYYAGPGEDIRWAHKDPDDAEWNEFVAGNASGGGSLLFGRLTYELMTSYWPTEMAAQQNPIVAKRMNESEKFVCSRTLDKVSWQNTTLLKGELVEEVRVLKQSLGEGIAILGSGSVVSQLATHGLIDEFQIVVSPLLLGDGKRLFDEVHEKLPLRLTRSRTFGNGSVLLCYEPQS